MSSFLQPLEDTDDRACVGSAFKDLDGYVLLSAVLGLLRLEDSRQAWAGHSKLRHVAHLHEQLPRVWNGLRISRQRSEVGTS